jgi:hypothetical protein
LCKKESVEIAVHDMYIIVACLQWDTCKFVEIFQQRMLLVKSVLREIENYENEQNLLCQLPPKRRQPQRRKHPRSQKQLKYELFVVVFL